MSRQGLSSDMDGHAHRRLDESGQAETNAQDPEAVVSGARLADLMEAVVQRELSAIRVCLNELLEKLQELGGRQGELLSAVELAELLKCDRRTVRRLELSGEMPVGLRIGGAKRWRASVIRGWLDELSESTAEGRMRTEVGKRDALRWASARGRHASLAGHPPVPRGQNARTLVDREENP